MILVTEALAHPGHTGDPVTDVVVSAWWTYYALGGIAGLNIAIRVYLGREKAR